MIVNNTPLETYNLHDVPVLVKREDLCCPFPGPSFSKIRGVAAHIQNRPESVIGVLDTFHSKAGWAVSYVCKKLGKKAVNFWPRYKKDCWSPDKENAGYYPRLQQRYASGIGAEMVDLKAGRSAVLFHQAKKILAERPDSYIMPNALKLPESITENADEAERTAKYLPVVNGGSGTLVISISSGTVAAGVLLGLHRAGVLNDYKVALHMGYSRSQDATLKYMEKVAGIPLKYRVEFIDEGYGYADAAKGVQVPFPCNPYYDAKAWKWLSKAISPYGAVKDWSQRIWSGPVVFWNIGD